MVLTNSGGIFANTGLLNDDGTLLERWQQDGCSLVNLFDRVDASNNFHSVSSNKTLYVKQIIYQCDGSDSSGHYFTVKDGSGGDEKYRANVGLLVANSDFNPKVINFAVPLKFTDSCYFYLNDSGDFTLNVTIVGWEE